MLTSVFLPFFLPFFLLSFLLPFVPLFFRSGRAVTTVDHATVLSFRLGLQQTTPPSQGAAISFTRPAGSDSSDAAAAVAVAMAAVAEDSTTSGSWVVDRQGRGGGGGSKGGVRCSCENASDCWLVYLARSTVVNVYNKDGRTGGKMGSAVS